jgi:hypothetical protein
MSMQIKSAENVTSGALTWMYISQAGSYVALLLL